jgi:hypothetical protein
MLGYGLGRFGDRRLEKGGPSCMPVLWRLAGGGCASDDWARIGLERSA